MNFTNPIFLIPITTGPIYMMAGFLMLKFPPKNINSLYGYRTGSSMDSQEKWDFAQPYSGKVMLQAGAALSLCALLGLFINLSELLGLLLGLVLLTIFTVYPIVKTERAIKRKFGKS